MGTTCVGNRCAPDKQINGHNSSRAESIRHAPPILMALRAEILSTETSDYLTQKNCLRSFYSVFSVVTISSRPDELLREKAEPKVG